MIKTTRTKPRRTGKPLPRVKAPANFRSERLMALASECPHCMNQSCRAYNIGQIVGCHPNSLRFGKGMGQKSHDLVAYLCGDCHKVLDGAGDRHELEAMFLDAFYWSTLWLIQANHLMVAA